MLTSADDIVDAHLPVEHPRRLWPVLGVCQFDLVSDKPSTRENVLLEEGRLCRFQCADERQNRFSVLDLDHLIQKDASKFTTG